MNNIFENQTFHEGLLLENQQNLIIRNCEFSNRNGDHGLRLINCRNVRVEKCRVIGVGNECHLALPGETGYAPFALLPTTQTPLEPWRDGTLAIPPAKYEGYIFTPLPGYGIHLINCHNVVVTNCDVLDVFGQGIVVYGDSRESSGNVTIEGNRIAYIYDDAVKFFVLGDQGDLDPTQMNLPFLGGVIRGNVIHDIGLGLTRLQAPRHGMYLKAADILVEDNTVYNCFYGAGISLRNAGIIRNNRVWNCALTCIVYQTQTLTEGSSSTVLIEGNECRQDFAFDLPVRGIYNPAGPFCPYGHGTILLGLSCYYTGMSRIVDRHSPLFVENFILRNNRSFLYRDFPCNLGERQIAHFNINDIGPDHKIEVTDNTLTDERPSPSFCLPTHFE
jgi:hypothetical protein